eukprot:9501987-Pyramimonas_sp.AAC.1
MMLGGLSALLYPARAGPFQPNASTSETTMHAGCDATLHVHVARARASRSREPSLSTSLPLSLSISLYLFPVIVAIIIACRAVAVHGCSCCARSFPVARAVWLLVLLVLCCAHASP